MASQRLHPKDVRAKLEQLIQQATTASPNLAQKLSALAKWIENKKDGLLMNKPSVLDLLTEVILDAELWLALSSLDEASRQQIYTEQGFPITDQYWLEVLFPKWINDRDPKFPKWKREVMGGKFKREDEPILRELSREIQRGGGSYLWKHLLDLSMATDLLASGPAEAPLCVQLTTVSGTYLTGKQQAWEATLADWNIERGLLISYNPMETNLVAKLVTIILSYSDAPLDPCYTVVTDL